MSVRVWGVVEDRLIEVLVEPGVSGLRIMGLPDDRARTTADRVRAALVNSRLGEAPSVTIRLQPPLRAGTTSDLDLALALATLVRLGVIGQEVRWIFATGRLGLDGSVHARDLGESFPLGEVVETLCRAAVEQPLPRG